MTSLTVLTINVWHGHATRGLARVPLEPRGQRKQRKIALQSHIARLCPDVVLLQECRPEPWFSASVADALGYDVVSQATNGGVGIGPFGLPCGGREGIAILARARSLRLRKLMARRVCGIGFNTRALAFQATELNYALVAEVVVAGQPVAIVCTHLLYALPDMSTLQTCWRALRERRAFDVPLPSWVRWKTRRAIDRRTQAVARLSRLVAALAENRPMVVGGDFNLEASAPSMVSLARDNRLAHAIEPSDDTPTWDPAGNPYTAHSIAPPATNGGRPSAYSAVIRTYDGHPQRPDHLLVSERDITVKRGRIVMGPVATDDVCPSDHYGVLAELHIAVPRTGQRRRE